MSSPAPGDSGGPQQSPKGLSKLVRRASRVFKRKSSTRGSVSGPSDVSTTVTGAPTVGPSAAAVSRYAALVPLDPQLPRPLLTFNSPPPIIETTTEEQPAEPDPVQVAPPPITPKAPTAAKPANARLATSAAATSAIQEEKARALFAKYGLTLEPGEWTSPVKSNVERVEKKIRMRVHRTCHRCQTTFGSEKVCSTCKHTRCKKCPRFPTKRAKEGKGKGAVTGAGVATIGDKAFNLKTLTITSQATGKQVVYKPVTQRVRRICHKCNTLFDGRDTQCVNCGHGRCEQCPREP